MIKAIDERMAWSGRCTECLSILVLFPSDEATIGAQKEISETWPQGWMDCPVEDCDGEIEWMSERYVATFDSLTPMRGVVVDDSLIEKGWTTPGAEAAAMQITGLAIATSTARGL